MKKKTFDRIAWGVFALFFVWPIGVGGFMQFGFKPSSLAQWVFTVTLGPILGWAGLVLVEGLPEALLLLLHRRRTQDKNSPDSAQVPGGTRPRWTFLAWAFFLIVMAAIVAAQLF